MPSKSDAAFYLSGAFLFTEVNSKGQVHGCEHRFRLTSLRMSDELPQALVHHRVKEGKVMPVHLKEMNGLVS